MDILIIVEMKGNLNVTYHSQIKVKERGGGSQNEPNTGPASFMAFPKVVGKECGSLGSCLNPHPQNLLLNFDT